jgi:general secretion pathway protein A
VYTDFFGLNEKPFSITPDPRYLYMTRRHADALAHLIYGVSESGGFIQLTGEVGTGKTTLIRSLLEQLPEKAKIAVILNPHLTAEEFLQVICAELRIPIPEESSNRQTVDALNRFLLAEHAQGRRVVLVVDEAQTLSLELLEQVRLLTNLETAKQKLLQIILIGQPELRDVLSRPDMRQLAQRVTGRYHLEPLTQEDTIAYVKHRMKVAGAQTSVFKPSAMRELYRRSGGIPRLVNVIADRALLAAYTLERTKIDARLVKDASVEVFGSSPARKWWALAGIATALILSAGAWRYVDTMATEEEVASEAAAVAGPISRDVLLPEEETASATTPIGELLADVGFPTDQESAFGALFSRWGLTFDPELGSPCGQAISAGLRCLMIDDGSVSQLRRLDRPSILTLEDESGARHFALMDGIGYDDVEFSVNDTVAVVDVADLTHYWHGEHTLLWRPGTPNARSIVPGDENESVLWLRDVVSQIYGSETVSDAPGRGAMIFDAELEAYVRDFQADNHLTVDGIVGARTQIALMTALGLGRDPVLRGSH